MKATFRISVTLVFLLVLAGCASTDRSRSLATDLKESLGKYKDDRDQAIQKVNASYRATYLSLMKQYRVTTDESLSIGRRTEARMAADEMLVDWQKKSTQTAVLASLDGTRTREMKAIDDRATAIADVRKRYADAYAALELELSKITAAQSKVADLAEKEDARASTITLLTRLAKAYQEVQKHESEANK
ncbi:MAG: hypothetical protein QM783_12410 [Phycisphaerales bacterium]